MYVEDSLQTPPVPRACTSSVFFVAMLYPHNKGVSGFELLLFHISPLFLPSTMLDATTSPQNLLARNFQPDEVLHHQKAHNSRLSNISNSEYTAEFALVTEKPVIIDVHLH